MSRHSFYEFACVCGERIRSEKEQAVCPACGRQIVIEWQAKYQTQNK